MEERSREEIQPLDHELQLTENLQELITESQNSFSDVISELPTYSFSLAKIKQIYDSAVSHKNDVCEANNCEKDLDYVALRQLETIGHINKRETNIDVKLKQARFTNKDLKSKISKMKLEMLEIDKRKTLEKFVMRHRLSLNQSNRKLVLPILTNQDMVFNVKKLTANTDARRKEIELLISARNTSYKPIATKERLLADLHEKDKLKMGIIEDNSMKPVATNNSSIAIQLLQASKNNGHTPDEAYNYLIQGFLNHKNTSLDSSVDCDDSKLERETEMLLNYLEKFNELFDEVKYSEAAIQAAHSPNGFLRTHEIMQRFINAPCASDQKPPIMLFCEALLDSVPAFGPLPHDMSILYAEVMLRQGKLDFLSQTISQNYLSQSNDLGFLLCSHRSIHPICLSLAHAVFSATQHRPMVASCLYHLQRPIALINYILQEFLDDDFMNFLCYEPTIGKAMLLLEPQGSHGPVIDLASLILLYLRNEMTILSVQLFFNYFDKSDPFSFGNQILYDVNTDVETWEEITELLYASGFSDIAERIFVSVLSRYIIYRANELYQNSL